MPREIPSHKSVRTCPALLARGRRIHTLITTVVIMGASQFYSMGAVQRSFVIEPVPAWVEPVALESAVDSNSLSTSSGSVCLVNDHQIRVSASSLERYYRRANKVLSSGGLDDLSQLELEFEPSYQKLAIHYIRIHRGEQVIDALNPSEVRVVQKEEELSQRLYNGTLSAVVFLNDVRIGDVIDYAYSVNGSNPVLNGQYADSYPLASRIATQRLRWRVLWPSSRKLLYRTRNSQALPSVKETGGQTEYLWQQNNVKEMEFEESTPSWFSPVPLVQVSEFADWSALARWALPLYAVQRPLVPALVSQIERWRKQSEAPERQLIEALRFVQDEVRYTGIELGPYSHMPTQPNIVFARRFGDCKDKSLLLCTILSELGIDAHPALVDTESRGTISEDQPSPYDFNHVIVRASLADKVYWLDATIGLQRGDLTRCANPVYGRALVIREGTVDLEEIPTCEVDAPTTEVKETYTASSYHGPGSLEVVTTYRLADADKMRYQLSQQSLSEVSKTYLSYYAQVDPSIQPVGSIQVEDDEASNTIRVTEHYGIPDFWKSGRREFYAGLISDRVGKLPAANRTSPLALTSLVYFSETIEARLPEHFPISGGSGTIATNQLDFRYSFISAGNTLTLAYQLRQRSDHVPVADLPRHSEAIGKIQKLLGYEITRDGDTAITNPVTALSFVPLLVIITPFAVFGAIKLMRRRRQQSRQTEYKRSLRVSRGESPESAIPVTSTNDFAAHLLAFRCPCGVNYSLSGPSMAQNSLTFDGRRMSVVSLMCNHCARTRDIYFTVSGTEPDR